MRKAQSHRTATLIPYLLPSSAFRLGEARQGLRIEAVLPAAELAGDQRLALGLEGGQLRLGHGAQHLLDALARAAAAGDQGMLAEDAHAVLMEQAEKQILGQQ